MDIRKKFNDMKHRCYCPTANGYKDYGGRGITIYQPWLDNPASFDEYILSTIGPCPPGHVIDRIDNDGNYEPGNLRWLSMADSNRNRRSDTIHNRRVGRSGYKWVEHRGPRRFVGVYNWRKQRHYVGHYSTPEQAYEAVVTYRNERGHPV